MTSSVHGVLVLSDHGTPLRLTTRGDLVEVSKRGPGAVATLFASQADAKVLARLDDTFVSVTVPTKVRVLDPATEVAVTRKA
jgi:hypothetical protein